MRRLEKPESGSRPIDILRSADRGDTLQVEFDIVLRNGIKLATAVLTAVDDYEIMKEQEKVYKMEYADCVRRGMDTLPIDEKEWEEYLASIENKETRKRESGNRPDNLAEQVARKIARMDTVQRVVPKFLRDQATGDKLFPTSEE